MTGFQELLSDESRDVNIWLVVGEDFPQHCRGTKALFPLCISQEMELDRDVN